MNEGRLPRPIMSGTGAIKNPMYNKHQIRSLREMADAHEEEPKVAIYCLTSQLNKCMDLLREIKHQGELSGGSWAKLDELLIPWESANVTD